MASSKSTVHIHTTIGITAMLSLVVQELHQTQDRCVSIYNSVMQLSVITPLQAQGRQMIIYNTEREVDPNMSHMCITLEG